MENKKFVEILKEARKNKGISQAKLAEMTGVTDRAIKYWESGRRGITLANADRLAKALEITITIGKE